MNCVIMRYCLFVSFVCFLYICLFVWYICLCVCLFICRLCLFLCLWVCLFGMYVEALYRHQINPHSFICPLTTGSKTAHPQRDDVICKESKPSLIWAGKNAFTFPDLGIHGLTHLPTPRHKYCHCLSLLLLLLRRKQFTFIPNHSQPRMDTSLQHSRSNDLS